MAEGTHLHIGILKAWELWFQGKDIKGDGDVLWGLGLIWWSRVGVIAGFLGGLIIVLDILGEEKLKKYGIDGWKEWAMDPDDDRVAFHARNVGYTFLLTAVGVAVVIWRPHHVMWLWKVLIFLYLSIPIVLILGLVTELSLRLLRSGKTMVVARLFALSMFVVSAHFTLLTS